MAHKGKGKRKGGERERGPIESPEGGTGPARRAFLAQPRSPRKKAGKTKRKKREKAFEALPNLRKPWWGGGVQK